MTTFLVLAHEQPDVLSLALRHLRDASVIVHVDAKSDIGPFREIAGGYSNVEFAATRYHVSWAGFSVCEAMFMMMEAALPVTGPGERIMILTGTCHPIRPLAEFEEHLAAHPQHQFIRYLPTDQFPDHFAHQTTRVHHRDARLIPGRSTFARRYNRKFADLRSAVTRKPLEVPPGVRIYAGQVHWTLTRECVEDVLNRRTALLDAYFRRVYVPDEKYLHTLVGNSPWSAATPAGGPERRACPDLTRMAPFHYIPDFIGAPIRDRDIGPMLNSEHYFARKFWLPDSAAALKAVQERLG